MKTVILLSTFQGEAYLSEQIASLQAQDSNDWLLFVRDDGSNDSTRKILSELAASDSRIHFAATDHEHLGVVASYGRLLSQATDADYVFFCDQDDVWLSTKISQSLTAIQMREIERGIEVPIAVHSDLQVCSEALRPQGPTMKAADFKRLGKLNFAELLAQNYVTGCSLVINRALARVATPIPSAALMHDWWIALLGTALGEVYFLDQVTVMYRQHGTNASGSARRLGLWAGTQKFFNKKNELRKLMQKRFAQSRALELRLAKYGSSDAMRFLRALHQELRENGGAAAAVKAWQGGLRLSDPARTLAYYYSLVRNGKSLLTTPK